MVYNTNTSNSQGTERGDSVGIQGLMKSLTETKTFSASFKEALNSTISIYETLASMYQVSNNEKLKNFQA